MYRSLWIVFVAIGCSLNVALAQQGERSGAAPRSEAESPQRPTRSEPPLTSGFGETIDRPPVPGFGLEAASAGGVRNQGVSLTERYHERIVAYAQQIIERYDRNQSSKLEREEWSSVRWRTDPASSDTDSDGVLTLEELCERVRGYDEFRGLGAATTLTSATGTSPATSAGDRAKFDEYAKGLLKRYDRNDSGVLERDEWESMSSYHRGADTSGDGIITREELANRLASYGSSSGSTGNSGGSASAGSAAADTRRPGSSSSGGNYRSSSSSSASRGGYRVRTATERQPKGLPDWFARNDADGDGQVSMAEFAVSWSSEKIAEFKEHDVSGDGIITPQECLAAGLIHRRDASATAQGAGSTRGR